MNRGTVATGIMAIAVTEPDLSLVVEIGARVAVRAGSVAAADLALGGSAVELLEALSVRRPLDQDVAAGSSWILQGLADTFDVEPGRRPANVVLARNPQG